MAATSSPVEICNLAIAELGQTVFIQSLTDNGNVEELCNLHYDRVRRTALQFFPFEFAIKREVLVASSEDPPSSWGFAYVYPTDCLRPLKIDEGLQQPTNDQLVTYLIENKGAARVIFTDHDAPCLQYIFDQKDVVLWTEAFIDAMAVLMAAKLAMPLTKDQSLAKDMLQLSRLRLQGAAAASATNIQRGEEPDAGAIRARL